MAIPITCAGCEVAFEVPDTVAGKTIRCTSCKTQVAVPVAVTATKKPFGSGATNALASKPSAPPTAKTKPRAVAVEEDDDDDDKAKTKPSKADKTPANGKKVVGAPKKRRDDDDDDDDDDDYMPKRKKKKNQSDGAKPMVAIIAGGVIALAAIVGLAIFLVRGDEEPETKTASTSSSSTSPSTTAPTPGANAAKSNITPQKTGNNRFGPGLEKVGTWGSWTSFKGDGYTVDLPGTPQASERRAEAATMFIHALTGKDDMGYMASHIPFPPDVVLALGNDPKRLLSTFMQGFTSTPEFKNRPTTDITVEGNPAQQLDVSAKKDGTELVRVVAANDRLFVFMACSLYENGKPLPKTDVDRFMNSVKITYKSDLVASGPGVPPRPPGVQPRDFTFPGGNPFGPPMGVVPPGGKPPVPPMGFVIPGLPAGVIPPPPPPGVVPPPGFVPPNAAGIGGGLGNDDGNLKVKIDPFYTAAFDAENKELYTIDLRPIGRTGAGGTLRRYNADYRQEGRYNIPQTAVRATIDSKAGLLYLATVTNPTTALLKEQYDNAAATGDIVAYDLKAIRDRKSADPKKPLEDGGDVKPLFTVKIGLKIHAIELSADGKNLYVLVTNFPAKKSQLVVIDTETRKEVLADGKRKNLPEFVRDMAKTGDGKNLLIIEEYNIRSKTTGVRIYELATMNAQSPIPFNGEVGDVAPLTGGGAIVTVWSPNGPAGGAGQPAFGGLPAGVGGQGQPVGLGGGPQQPQVVFKLFLMDGKGLPQEIELPAGRLANGGYAEYDADNKKLFVSSYRGAGFDVYDVADSASTTGLKPKSSIRTARKENMVGGHFFISPDGKVLLFHTGVILATDNIGGGVDAGGGLPIRGKD